MITKTQLFLELWTEARTRFTDQLANLTEEDLKKRLPPSVNSVGFLMRHIGDVESYHIPTIMQVRWLSCLNTETKLTSTA